MSLTYADFVIALSKIKEHKQPEYSCIIHPRYWNGYSYVVYPKNIIAIVSRFIGEKLHIWKLYNRFVEIHSFIGWKYYYSSNVVCEE